MDTSQKSSRSGEHSQPLGVTLQQVVSRRHDPQSLDEASETAPQARAAVALLPRGRGRGRDRGLGTRGCGQGKRRRSTEPNDESGAGPEQPLDSEVHGPPTVYNQTAAGVVPQLQDEALHAQHMPAGLGSGATGFVEANSVGPGDGDANEDAEDAAQHLVEDIEVDVRRQKASRTVDKAVQKAAREAAEAAWERHDIHELAAQSQAASAGKPKKIIKSDIVNLFVAWQLDKKARENGSKNRKSPRK